jgi:hypothetical protein
MLSFYIFIKSLSFIIYSKFILTNSALEKLFGNDSDAIYKVMFKIPNSISTRL